MTDLSPFEGIILRLRAEWQRIATPTGRPRFGPSWYAVTVCDECGNRGFTDSNSGSGLRFACITCYGFCEPVAFEGKERTFVPVDEALDEYGAWRGKQSKNSDFGKRRIRWRLPM